MNFTDEEMDLLNEVHEKRKAFVAAKAEHDRDSAECQEAKAAYSEARTFWRQIREMVPSEEDVDTRAIAAPVVGVGSGIQQGGASAKESEG